jgi:hypothetical protein
MAGFCGAGFDKIIIQLLSIRELVSMNDYLSFRKCISNNDKELLIYGVDNFSQFPRRDASVSSKRDRTLPVACRDDLVVLRGKLDMEYHNWLRSHAISGRSWEK